MVSSLNTQSLHINVFLFSSNRMNERHELSLYSRCYVGLKFKNLRQNMR